HAGSALGNPNKAVVFALRAAESAVRVYAYEDALLHYDRAIETLEGAGLIHDERLARTYILKGSALKQLGKVQQSIDVLVEAAKRIQVLGNAELLVDVLVFLVESSSHVAQQHIVPLLERVLTLLPKGDSVARAKALAMKAFAYRTSPDKSCVQLLVDEGLDVAGRSCDDRALCACYQLMMLALR